MISYVSLLNTQVLLTKKKIYSTAEAVYVNFSLDCETFLSIEKWIQSTCTFIMGFSQVSSFLEQNALCGHYVCISHKSMKGHSKHLQMDSIISWLIISLFRQEGLRTHIQGFYLFHLLFVELSIHKIKSWYVWIQTTVDCCFRTHRISSMEHIYITHGAVWNQC